MEIKKCNTCGRSYKGEKDFLIGTSRFRKCDQGHIWFNCACNSTLLLPKSLFSIYKPESQVSSEAMKLFYELEALKNLPPISNVVVRVEEALNKESTDAKSLADILLDDPTLSGKILAIANATATERGTKISSVQHAVGILGREQLRSICLTAMIKKVNFNFVNFSVAGHWKHALLAGHLARKIAEIVYKDAKDDLSYLTTVLSNMGRLVLGIVFPSELELMAAKVLKEKISWPYAENLSGSYSHSLLGEIGAAMWGLPNEVLLVCARHHDVKFVQDLAAETKKLKSFDSLKDAERDEALLFISMMSNDFAHDILQQPWRKSSTATVSQIGLGVLYNMNLTPGKLISDATLKSIESASALFV